MKQVVQRTIRLVDGSTRNMSYRELCSLLGFSADIEFVHVTTRGTISFSAGKPNEIRALLAACHKEGIVPAKSLVGCAGQRIKKRRY